MTYGCSVSEVLKLENQMDYENYDDDTNESDDDYFDFIHWLSDLAALELREAKGNPEQQKQALCRYWKRGDKANVSPGALLDYLCVSSPSIFDLADYTEEEGDTAIRISDSLTRDEINRTLLPDAA